MIGLVVAFTAGAIFGGAVVAWGSWLAFRDNARRYFTLRGYGQNEARREADRAMGVEWYDPRDEQEDSNS